jgi:hypothetical protein
MPVPTLISQLSTTASLNSPDGAVDVPSSIDDYQRAHASFIAVLRDQATSIINGGTPVTNATNVTGTTTAAIPVTALGSGTANATTFLRGDRTFQPIAAPTIASTAEAQAGTNNTNFLTPLRLREGVNAAGTAPIYACRAWVNFDGTGTVAIRASGNVSSIADVGVGNYFVNFTTAMQDANYCALGSVGNTSSGSLGIVNSANRGVGSCQIFPTVGTVDASCIDVAIFR